MIQENEVVTLFLGIGGLIFLIISRHNLKKIPYYRLIASAYVLILLSWIFTVTEGFFWPYFQNLLEHICYMSGMGVLLIWCCKFFFNKKPEI